MKNIRIAVCLLASMYVVSAYGMQQPEKSIIARFREFVNLKSFSTRLLGLYFEKEDKEIDCTQRKGSLQEEDKKRIKREFIKDSTNALIDAFSLGKLINPFNHEKQKTFDHYFDIGRLKELLKTVNNDCFMPSLSADEQTERKVFYVRSLKNALRFDVLKAEWQGEEYLEIETAFEDAIKYLKGQIKTLDCLHLEKMPAFGGYAITSYSRVERLKLLINSFLQQQSITSYDVLECIKFQSFFEWIGCPQEDIEQLNKWTHALMGLALDFVKDDTQAARKILVCMSLMRHAHLIELIDKCPDSLEALLVSLNEQTLAASNFAIQHTNIVQLVQTHSQLLDRLFTQLNPETLEMCLAALARGQKR